MKRHGNSNVGDSNNGNDNFFECEDTHNNDDIEMIDIVKEISDDKSASDMPQVEIPDLVDESPYIITLTEIPKVETLDLVEGSSDEARTPNIPETDDLIPTLPRNNVTDNCIDIYIIYQIHKDTMSNNIHGYNLDKDITNDINIQFSSNLQGYYRDLLANNSSRRSISLRRL